MKSTRNTEPMLFWKTHKLTFKIGCPQRRVQYASLSHPNKLCKVFRMVPTTKTGFRSDQQHIGGAQTTTNQNCNKF